MTQADGGGKLMSWGRGGSGDPVVTVEALSSMADF